MQIIKKNIIIFIVLLLFITGLLQSEKANWDLLRKWSPDKILGKISSSMIFPRWIEGTEKFWYIYTDPIENHYWLVNPLKKSKSELFDKKVLANLLISKTKKLLNYKKLYFKNMVVTESGNILSFEYNSIKYKYHIKKAQLRKIAPIKTIASKGYLNISPNAKYGLFQKGNNLYLSFLNKTEKKEKQLTIDGKRGVSWGTSVDLVDISDLQNRKIDGVWSPDSTKFCVLRQDARKVPDLWLIEYLAEPLPKLKTYKSTHPGGNVPQWELWIVDVINQKMIKINTFRWIDQTLEELFGISQWWNKESDKLYFTRRHRNFKKVDLCVFDLKKSKVKIIVEERIKGQVYIKPLVFLPEKNKLLWWSQRDGFGHYYILDQKNKTIKPLTKGSFNSIQFKGLDIDNNSFIMINGKNKIINPYYEFLYKVNINSNNLTLLTPENANHTIFLSPDKKYFVDNFSRVDMPSQSVLRNSNGKIIMNLEKMNISTLKNEGWQEPEVFKAKAADGITDLWGVMYKPFNFNPQKKYPIITRVYPGRQSEFLPFNFSPISFDSTLAQLGFIVVRFGNRGGCFSRGVKYREYGREQFRDYGLADKKVVIESLAKKHTFIDIEKTGIFGSSSGGFMTTSAMLVYPDFFKVGVAAASPNDPSVYFNQWVERYKGIEEIISKDGKSKSWKSTAKGNLEIAKNLKGKLLMIYGAQDDNVHPAHLLRMADNLIKAGKMFDMFLVPGAGHGVGGWRLYYSLVADYFARHLLNSNRSGAEILFKK